MRIRNLLWMGVGAIALSLTPVMAQTDNGSGNQAPNNKLTRQYCQNPDKADLETCQALLDSVKKGKGQKGHDQKPTNKPAAPEPAQKAAPVPEPQKTDNPGPAKTAPAEAAPTPQPVAPAEAPPAEKAAPANAVPQPEATPQPKAQKAAPDQKRVRLPKACVAAGLTTKQDCDAFIAEKLSNKKAKVGAEAPAPAPQAVEPTQPDATKPADTIKPADRPRGDNKPGKRAPAAADKNPADVTPAKPAAEKPTTPAPDTAPATEAKGPALPDIEAGLNAAAKSYNLGVAALVKAGSDKAAATKANADITAAQAQIDALCKSNNFDSSAKCLAQFGISLTPMPNAKADQGANAPVQPVEEIKNLPKGVTQNEVAPLLDSAKDRSPRRGNRNANNRDNNGQNQQQPVQNAQTQQAAQAPQGPPPKNDREAQNTIKHGNIIELGKGQGKRVDRNYLPDRTRPKDAKVIQQNDAQTIFQLGAQIIINNLAQDQRRLANQNRDQVYYEDLPRGRSRETIERPNGVKVVTVYNRNGDILRRSRIDARGREHVLAEFDNSHTDELLNWRDPGDSLPPLRLHIPARDYVLDAGQADERQIRGFFAEPPVERVQRLYSIDEVKRSARVRDMVRRLEIGNLTFDTGAATISRSQVSTLSNVASAMQDLLAKNPAETFLIEGHTDAVGSDIDNLKLSDERAATVASVLTDFYQIPPENLVTQGYGERFLKVDTNQAERINRRVTIRRITPLITLSNSGN